MLKNFVPVHMAILAGVIAVCPAPGAVFGGMAVVGFLMLRSSARRE
jgi:hypothetical protein